MHPTHPPAAPPDALARLEAKVRWLTALTTFLVLAFAGLLLWEFLPRTVQVEANRFVLRDTRWGRRAELGFRDDGSPALRLLNPAGRTRLALYLSPDGAGTLRMADTQGTERVRLGLTPAGDPLIALADAGGESGVHAAVDAAGRPTIRLEQDGRQLWRAPQ